MAVSPTLPLKSSHGPAMNAGDNASTLVKRVYLGSWSHTGKPDRFSPSDMTKKDFGELLLSLWDGLFCTLGPKRQKVNRLLKLSVFEEKHSSVFGEEDADGTIHYHFLILGEYQWHWKHMAKRLREHGIYANFSAHHTYYWDALLYVAVPSDMPEGKREADLDHNLGCVQTTLRYERLWRRYLEERGCVTRAVCAVTWARSLPGANTGMWHYRTSSSMQTS